MASYYRNLEVWKKAFELNKQIYPILKTFPVEEKFSLVDQMRRSALSIASNIAEWSGRGSSADYIRFLHIAKGSCMELETQILLSESFNYISHEISENLLETVDEVNRMIFGMIKKL